MSSIIIIIIIINIWDDALPSSEPPSGLRPAQLRLTLNIVYIL